MVRFLVIYSEIAVFSAFAERFAEWFILRKFTVSVYILLCLFDEVVITVIRNIIMNIGVQ